MSYGLTQLPVTDEEGDALVQAENASDGTIQ
jgi:hypothetical protein